MKINAEVLERMIQESINTVVDGPWIDESFAIHEDKDTDIQVQIVVTGNARDHMDTIWAGAVEPSIANRN